MEQRLLGFSGKLQSGKDSAATFVERNAIELFGAADAGGTRAVVRRFYYGGAMKDFCEKHFRVPRELLWGTDEQKATPTTVRWRSLPHWLRLVAKKEVEAGPVEAAAWAKRVGHAFLTVRELLQQVGEEMFLDMNPAVWTDATEGEVRSGQFDVGLFPDPRKPEQIDSIHRLGGKVIRLTRRVKDDRHVSETALDPENYDWSNFDAVVDNARMTLAETHGEVAKALAGWGWLRQGPDLGTLGLTA